MARRRRRSQRSVSLFPFLSILACVIGTLTLMITALALGQMDNETVASAEKFELAKRLLEEILQQIERLEQELAKAESTADDTQKVLADLRERLERLRREKENLIAENQRPLDVEIPTVDPAGHEKRLAALNAELEELQERISKLRQQIAAREKPPDEAQVLIRPGGTGVDLDPTFVECAAGSIVIYEGDKPPRIAKADLTTNKQFLALLDRIAAAPKATVIFLIRDDALGTYRIARDVARSRYARNGKLPVIGHGKIDLSMFEK